MIKKFNCRRYHIYAKRDTKDNWSEWTQVNDFDRVVYHANLIEEQGFLTRVYDKKTKKELLLSGSQKIS